MSPVKYDKKGALQTKKQAVISLNNSLSTSSIFRKLYFHNHELHYKENKSKLNLLLSKKIIKLKLYGKKRAVKIYTVPR